MHTTVEQQLTDSKLALLYLATQELNAAFSVDDVIQRTLRATVRITGASRGSFVLVNGDVDSARGWLLDGANLSMMEKQTTALILQEGLAGWVQQHHRPALITDTATDRRWLSHNHQDKALAAHSAIAVPLMANDTLMGILTLSHIEAAYFSDTDLHLTASIAEQAATAILKIRLYQKEKQERLLADTIAGFVQQLHNIPALKTLLNSAFEYFARILSFDYAIIFLWEKDYLTVAGAYGVNPTAGIETMSVELYQNDFARLLVVDGQPLRTADLQREDSWFRDVSDCCAGHGWMGIPLVAGERQLGIVTFAASTFDAYSAADERAAVSLGRQVALAINDFRLLRRLQDIEKRYTSLFEESSDCLLIVRPDGEIRDANRKACQIFRRPKDVIVGSHVALLDGKLQETLTRHASALKPGKTITEEVTIKDAYGQPVALEMTARYIDLDGERVIQWTGYDVTVKQQLAAMRQDLTNMIVHDLRGPTGTLIGAVQMLEMLIHDIADADVRDELLEVISLANRSGQYLRDLIDSVLDLSKLERGTLPLNIAPVSLDSLFAAVKDQTLPQAEFKEITLTFPENTGKTVNLDRNVIRRVLVNLVDNAIKYTPANGNVTVTVETEYGHHIFVVSDDGPGIAPDSQMRIFDKFTRATADATIQGVGLGLAFCKLAVEAHGGEIWLESEVGQGSHFYFSIPDDLSPAGETG